MQTQKRTLGDERPTGGLYLVVAAIILWNTVYLAEAVEQLRREGVTIKEEDLQHVSPLGWEHIILTGDFYWNVKQVPFRH